MKKTLLALAILASASFGALATQNNGCGNACTGTTVSSVNPTVAVSGTVSNSISSYSTATIGTGGTSFAQSSAGVTEFASASGSAGSKSVANGIGSQIAGQTATAGSAFVTGLSSTTGTGVAQTSGVAYGSASADLALSSKTTNAGGSTQITGALHSDNTVGIGYATAAGPGHTYQAGAANVVASSGNTLTNAYATLADCLPGQATGVASDTKTGGTATPGAVVVGNGTAFSPFTSGMTGVANQNVLVNASFTTVSAK